MTIKINKENFPLYKKIINEYEKNNVDQNKMRSIKYIRIHLKKTIIG